MVDVQTQVVGVFLFVILITIALYIASFMLPDSIATWFNATATLDSNANVPDYFIALMNITPIGILIGLMLAFIFVGLMASGVVKTPSRK